MKRRLLLLMVAVLIIVSSAASADEPPYRSFSYTPDSEPFFMQSPYVPMELVGQNLYTVNDAGEHERVNGLRNPADFCPDSDGNIYVADRDNNRILKMTIEGEVLNIFGEGILRNPEGVFAADDGMVYIADTGNARIAVLDCENNLVANLSAPNDVRLENIMFTPTKVAMDRRGYIYILLKGGNDGLMLMDITGKFQGYFGRNATQLTISERIKRLIYTDEQIATNLNAVSPSISGMCISGDGFIYTCTSTLSDRQIKKFNASGTNLFSEINTQVQVSRRDRIMSAVSSIFVTDNGIIYGIDNFNGSVIIYESNGKPLITFGEKLLGNDKRIGYFSDPVAISVTNDGTLLVLDKGYNGFHVFQPTELMSRILDAVSLYDEGLYSETEDAWENILKMNANYYWANLGLGKIAYMNKDYKAAMRYMKLASNQEYYSDAQWKQRALVVQKYAAPVIGILVVYAIIHFLTVKITGFNVYSAIGRGIGRLNGFVSDKMSHYLPRTSQLLYQMRYSLRMLRHPIDTYYEATRLGRGSIASAIGMYVVFFAVMIAERAFTNFVFDENGIHGVDLVSAAATYVLPVLLWIAANYLVGSITKGQGTFKGVVISTVYALMPLIVFTIPLALISNVLTLAEGSIYWIIRGFLYLWVLFLLFIQVKEIHGYEFGETIKNILWILFVAVMTMVAVMAVAGILMQAYNFLNEFIRELLGYV